MSEKRKDSQGRVLRNGGCKDPTENICSGIRIEMENDIQFTAGNW